MPIIAPIASPKLMIYTRTKQFISVIVTFSPRPTYTREWGNPKQDISAPLSHVKYTIKLQEKQWCPFWGGWFWGLTDPLLGAEIEIGVIFWK